MKVDSLNKKSIYEGNQAQASTVSANNYATVTNGLKDLCCAIKMFQRMEAQYADTIKKLTEEEQMEIAAVSTKLNEVKPLVEDFDSIPDRLPFPFSSL